MFPSKYTFISSIYLVFFTSRNIKKTQTGQSIHRVEKQKRKDTEKRKTKTKREEKLVSQKNRLKMKTF